jgi:hypothetical protein
MLTPLRSTRNKEITGASRSQREIDALSEREMDILVESYNLTPDGNIREKQKVLKQYYEITAPPV